MKGFNLPFHNWVPKPLGIFIYVFMFVPALFISGAYTSNAGEMVGSLGIMTEHIQYANFATAVGMTVFTPFTILFLEIRRSKMVYLIGLSALAFISYICAETNSMPLLIICSFITGFIRIILIFNTLFGLLGYITGKDIVPLLKPSLVEVPKETEAKMEKIKAMALPFLYLFFLMVGQLGSFVTAWLAYSYMWQYVYYFMIALTLICLLLVELTMVYQKRKKAIRLTFTKFSDIVCASLLLLSFSFILIYGKTLDWFDNSLMNYSLVILLLSTGVFFILETYSKRPYLDLKIFSFQNVIIALLVFVMLMVLNSSSILVSTFVSISMKIDNWQNAVLSNYSLIGYVIGAILATLMAKLNMHFKYIFSIGFLFITIAAVYMYFQVQSMGLYENMIFPVIIRSAGMLILYATAGIWGMRKLNMMYLTTWIFLMLTFRSVIGPVAGTSLYTNVLNEKQSYYISRLSQNVDMLNPEIAGIFTQSQMGNMMQGKSVEDAQILATQLIKGRIQIQATLAALKEISGWTIYGGIACIVVVIAMPYSHHSIKKKFKSNKEYIN